MLENTFIGFCPHIFLLALRAFEEVHLPCPAIFTFPRHLSSAFLTTPQAPTLTAQTRARGWASDQAGRGGTAPEAAIPPRGGAGGGVPFPSPQPQGQAERLQQPGLRVGRCLSPAGRGSRAHEGGSPGRRVGFPPVPSRCWARGGWGRVRLVELERAGRTVRFPPPARRPRSPRKFRASPVPGSQVRREPEERPLPPLARHRGKQKQSSSVAGESGGAEGGSVPEGHWARRDKGGEK